MKFETKFEVGQKVWRNLHYSPDGPFRITGINVELGVSWRDGAEYNEPSITYCPGGIAERYLYATKEEARIATLAMLKRWERAVEDR